MVLLGPGRSNHPPTSIVAEQRQNVHDERCCFHTSMMETSAHLSTLESALQGALSHLQCRSIVEETIQSMLLDVELAATLSRDLVVMEQHEELQQRSRSFERALQEGRAVEQALLHQNRQLADELVKELWSLSQDIGALKRWKDQHQPIVEQHDELIAKLIYAKDQIEILTSRPPATPIQNTIKQEANLNRAELEMSQVSADDPVDVKGTPTTTSKEKELEIALKVKTAGETKEEIVEEQTNNLIQEQLGESEVQEEVPLVVMLSQDDEKAPSLESLKVPILMKIFSFLDAMEILSLAQVNVVFFSRVDSLFGSGEGLPDPPIPTVIETIHMEPKPTIVQIPPDPSVTPIPQMTVPTAAQKVTIDTKPPAVKKASPLLGGHQGRQNIFTLLQKRAAIAAPRVRDRISPIVVKQHQLITEAMATSMASKLSDVELSAIISMRTQLHQREKDVNTLIEEKETLSGKLEGTEAVKKFLIAKVREVEHALLKSQEDESKVTQQIASDQEVIAFLDSNVLELERNTKALATELKATHEELNRIKTQNGKKITVLSDMLQFEREQSTENEKEWKATKKVLVKEVKNCRMLITELQVERDGYREQNERLRRSILSNGVLMNGSPSRGNRDDRY